MFIKRHHLGSLSIPRSVFISYARKDAHWVSIACRLFQITGTRIFLDVTDIEYGARWQDELEKALSECTRVVVFWSAAASNSEWVEREWRLALALNKRIIPVLLDPTPLCDELSVFNASTDLLELINLAKAKFAAEDAFMQAAEDTFRQNNAKIVNSEFRHLSKAAPWLIDMAVDIQRPHSMPTFLWVLIEKPIRALVKELVTQHQRRWEKKAEWQINEQVRKYSSYVNELFEREVLEINSQLHNETDRLARTFFDLVFANDPDSEGST